MQDLFHTETITAITMLFTLMNPFALLGIYLVLVKNLAAIQRTKFLLVALVGINVTLFSFLFVGMQIMSFFGIDIAGFTTAGGLIILLIGLSMIKSKHEEHRSSGIEVLDKLDTSKPYAMAIVPLTIPILAGPGTISTVLNMTNMFDAATATLSISIGIISVSLIVFVVFYFGPTIFQKLGKTGLNIITKIMGLILIALAFDMLAKGIIGLFPVLSQ